MGGDHAPRLQQSLRFAKLLPGYIPGVGSDEETKALVQKFHDAGKRLTSKPEYTDEEMGAVDQAQVQRLEALQELANRVSLEGTATLLGMTAKEVEDELRVDRTIE